MHEITMHTGKSNWPFQNSEITFPPIYYDACEAEILDAPTSSKDIIPKTMVKRDPDFKRLRPLFD
jgi:hypothetical protein